MENDKGFDDYFKRWLRRKEHLTAIILGLAILMMIGGK